MNGTALPQRGGRRFVTDGGLETDLIFHHGVDLPEFAAFPLLDQPAGRELLSSYFQGYAEIARDADAGLLLETATWRASADWGERVGYSPDQLHAVNVGFVHFLSELADEICSEVDGVLISGMIGPRGDGYQAGTTSADAAQNYHRAQLTAFAEGGADLASALTLTTTEEAIGIVRAAREVALPVAISFTVETDGRLPSGQSLSEAIELVDDEAPPDYYLLNCAHPDHLARALGEGGTWRDRIIGTRVNASRLSHAELDEAQTLDDGDVEDLAAAHERLTPLLGEQVIVGGCCGTDVRHVARLWRNPSLRPAG